MKERVFLVEKRAEKSWLIPASCNDCGWQSNGEILSRFPETARRLLEQEHYGFAVRTAMIHHSNEAYSLELLDPYICPGPVQLKVESL